MTDPTNIQVPRNQHHNHKLRKHLSPKSDSEYIKGSVSLRRSENIRKIENEYFVHCLVSWCSLMFKLLSEKMPVFKIEYLSSYNHFFRIGVLCLH